MKSGYRKPSQTASDKYPDGGAMLSVNEGLVMEEGECVGYTAHCDYSDVDR